MAHCFFLVIIVVFVLAYLWWQSKDASRRKHQRLLQPLAHLLDISSPQIQSSIFGSAVKTRLEGPFRGRQVKFHLAERIGAEQHKSEIPANFRIELSCKSTILWFFVVTKGSFQPLGFTKKLKVDDPELDDEFRFYFMQDEEPGESVQFSGWVKRSEDRSYIRSLLLPMDACRLEFQLAISADDEDSGFLDPDGPIYLKVTYSPYREEYLEVGNVRSALQTMEMLVQALEQRNN